MWKCLCAFVTNHILYRKKDGYGLNYVCSVISDEKNKISRYWYIDGGWGASNSACPFVPPKTHKILCIIEFISNENRQSPCSFRSNLIENDFPFPFFGTFFKNFKNFHRCLMIYIENIFFRVFFRFINLISISNSL